MPYIKLCLPTLAIILFPALVDAQHIVNAHINAIGGADNIAKVKTIQRSGEVKIAGPFGEFDGAVTENFDAAGSRGHRMLDIGIAQIESGWDDKSGWQTVPQQGIVDMNEKQLTITKINGSASPVAAAKAKFGIDGFSDPVEEDFNEKPCVQISVGDGLVTFCINKETKLLEGLKAPGGAIITFEDYAEVEGVKFAGKMTTNQPERDVNIVITYKETELNGEIDESGFANPDAP